MVGDRVFVSGRPFSFGLPETFKPKFAWSIRVADRTKWR